MKRLILMHLIIMLLISVPSTTMAFEYGVYLGEEADTLVFTPDSVRYANTQTRGKGLWHILDNKIHIEFDKADNLTVFFPRMPGQPLASLKGYYMNLEIKSNDSLSCYDYVYNYSSDLSLQDDSLHQYSDIAKVCMPDIYPLLEITPQKADHLWEFIPWNHLGRFAQTIFYSDDVLSQLPSCRISPKKGSTVKIYNQPDGAIYDELNISSIRRVNLIRPSKNFWEILYFRENGLSYERGWIEKETVDVYIINPDSDDVKVKPD